MAQFDFLQRILFHLENNPERHAFYIAENWYSYGALSAVIAHIQSLVSTSGVETAHVGLYLADDIHTYASILALWMSGKAFVPLNPLFPEARNRNITDQLDLKLVLHSGEIEEEQFQPGCKALCTADLSPGIPGKPDLFSFNRDADAYVLFTSGTTGNPKGVRISFNNLNAFVRDFIAYPAYSFEPDDRFLQIYDLSFDASVHCYTVPLTIGASVYTVPPDGIKYLAAYKLMQEQQLTFVKMPPSILSYLRPHFSTIHLPELKYCLLGGEAFPALLAGEWESCIPNALIQNVYGPTEATINCLIYDWNGRGNSRKESGGIASIGKGFGSNVILVADEKGNPVSTGERGELLVTGDQVSPGYWNNPELDDQAFMTLEREGEVLRFYRTGDEVFVDEEGDVMFVGRNDEQIQVRGYRVELGEIELLARTFLNGLNVMASGREQAAGEMKIFLVVETGEMDPGPLMDFLETQLPSYMIPDKIIALPDFPRLVSGKMDRKAINDFLPS